MLEPSSTSVKYPSATFSPVRCPVEPSWRCDFQLVDLLLFVKGHLPRSHIDQKQETSNNGKDLEEVVFRKVLVWVVRVELKADR